MLNTPERVEVNSEAVGEFLEHFEKDAMEEIFLQIEDAFIQGDDSLDSQGKINLLQNAFRYMHSLKGTAGVLKIGPMVSFLHLLEDSLSQLSQQATRIVSVKNTSIFDIYFKGLDLIEQIATALQADGFFLVEDSKELYNRYMDIVIDARRGLEDIESYLELSGVDEDLF